MINDSDIREIYNDLILEHNKKIQNQQKLEPPFFSQRGFNPNCGDDLTLSIKYDSKKDKITNASFEGNGCAISKASTSILIDLIINKSKEEALLIIDYFIDLILNGSCKHEDVLEDAIYLKPISKLPARVKCAVLSWHSLKIILNQIS